MVEFQDTVDESELKVPDRFGVFPRWPADGTDWIHDEDVEIVTEMGLIPSRRIFQRHRLNGDFSRITYGELEIRIRPVLWLEVKIDGYLVGDRVEIRSRMGANKPDIATITEMFWNRQRGMVEYRLTVRENLQHNEFFAADFQPVFKLGEPLTARQAELLAKSRLM